MTRVARSALALLMAASGAAAIAAGDSPAEQPMAEHADQMMMHPHPHLPPATGAYQHAFPLPDEAAEERFDRGRNVLNKVWVIAPSEDALHDGLGPLFNQRSCIACHPANGRGHVPETPDVPMVSALVRLSVRDRGQIVPHPAYGEQLNEQGTPDVPGEGHAEVSYTLHKVKLSDGTVIELRKPHLTFRELHYGPIAPSVMTSLRVAPAIFGLGLLELVAESALLEYADPNDRNHDGISGRPNLIRDGRRGVSVPGRFGWKASSPDLFTQIASAFNQDLGLTTLLMQESNCTRAETACLEAPSGGDPEVAHFMMENLTTYLMYVAPPDTRNIADAEAARGAELFRSIGCAACHRETLTTRTDARNPGLSGKQFHPYTDLLLHDLGPGLADGRPDHDASGSEWRTAPLWGIGLAQQIDPDARFLHDGRARSLVEAIVWHDGEARGARDRFGKLSAADRAALLAFLGSL